KWCFDFLLVFVYIYGMVFSILPFAASKFILLFLVCYSLLKPRIYKSVVNNRLLLYCILVWLIVSTHFLFVTLLSGSRSFGFLQQTFWYFLEGIFGSFLLFDYLKGRYNQSKLLYLLFSVFVVQSFFVVLSFVSTTFRDITNIIL